MEETTRKTVLAYKQGRKEEFEKLLRQFQPLIQKYVRYFPKEESEDVRQELSLALYLALETIDYTESEKQCVFYLAKSIRTKFAVLYNRTKKRRETEIHIPEDMDFAAQQNPYQDTIFYTDLEKHISQLSKTKKEILLRLADGQKDLEIAQELHVSKQYVNRTKKTLFPRQ